MLAKKLMGSSAAATPFVDDVFQTVLRTGTGATATVTTGFQPDLVWTKGRTSATSHFISDSAQGMQYYLQSNSTSARLTGNYVTQTSTGFTWAGASFGDGGIGLVDFVWKKAPKFFDVVTFVAGSNSNRRVSHSLGSAPGMIVLKMTTGMSNWIVYHRSLGKDYRIKLNLTDAQENLGNVWGTAEPTASDFGINEPGYLASGQTYVAYLFAHDTSTDGIIQCGSFTTDGSGNATVNLGWETQWLMTKRTSSARDWSITDSMRGWPVNAAAQKLYPNLSNAETSGNENYPTATGFTHFAGDPSATYVYVAIRRPNKPPTTGTSVYNAIARTGTGAVATVTGVGFAPDLAILWGRNGYPHCVFDRLRGTNQLLETSATSAETTLNSSVLSSFNMDGVSLGADGTYGYVNSSPISYINHFFRRAPGVMDVALHTGIGIGPATVNHNLGVIPELIITKSRNVDGWWVASSATITTGSPFYADMKMETTAACIPSNGVTVANIATITSSSFQSYRSATDVVHVNYLFATKAGISKVGSYTGNGSSQTINCGFTTGARFILIKRTDSTGDWKVIDTARGLIAGNDPTLALNSTAAEVTSTDCVDPDNSGFIVNQEATNNLNVNAATYIYLSYS